jgi:hypothetical protein
MNDLIFVPEIGLISGRGQKAKARLWYPQPVILQPRLKTGYNTRARLKKSPFNQTQQLFPYRRLTQSPRKAEEKTAKSSLDSFGGWRIGTAPGKNRRKGSNSKKNELKIDSEGIIGMDLELIARPATMAGGKRQKVKVEEMGKKKNEDGLSLPELNQRPGRTADEPEI